MKEKAQEKDLGQVTSRERNESEPLPCRKELDGVETTVVKRSWDKAPAGTCLRTERHPAYRWPEPGGGGRMEQENLGVDVNGEATSGVNHEGESPNAALRGGLPGSSEEAE